MKKHFLIAVSVLAAALGATGVTTAVAESRNGAADQAEMQALQRVKLSMIDVIKAAEAAQPGRTAEVQFDLENGSPAFEVTVFAADGTEHNMMVDANSGNVEKLAANEDKAGVDEDSRENGESRDGDNG